MNILLAVAMGCLALLFCDGAKADHRQLLEQLCHMDANAPQVTRLSDVGAMIRLLKIDRSLQCPAAIAQAIIGLEPLIELRDVCSEEAADLIVDYWAKYINDKSPLSRNFPRSLRSLFIGYGLQASKLCKITMMNELQKATYAMEISEQDVLIVTKSIVENKKVRKMFGNEPRLEDLLIVVRTDSVRNDPESETRNKINMPPKERKYFELMRERCIYKFKPIYDSLISPIVRLASIGMNYKAAAVDQAFNSFRRQKIYTDWFNVIVACEAIVRHEPVLIPAKKLNAVSGDIAMITILEADDLAELREQTGLSLDEPAIGDQLAVRDYSATRPVRMYNQIIDLNDAYLIESIKSYGHGLEEVTKFKIRMIKNLPSVMKQVFKGQKAVKFGLHGAEQKVGKLKRFGSVSHRAIKRLAMIGVSLFLITGAALSTGALIIFASPLTPVWLFVGGWIITVILLSTIVAVLSA